MNTTTQQPRGDDDEKSGKLISGKLLTGAIIVVFLGAIADINGKTATATASGYFDYTFTTTSTGTISAITTDWWGQDSAIVSTTI